MTLRLLLRIRFYIWVHDHVDEVYTYYGPKEKQFAPLGKVLIPSAGASAFKGVPAHEQC